MGYIYEFYGNVMKCTVCVHLGGKESPRMQASGNCERLREEYGFVGRPVCK